MGYNRRGGQRISGELVEKSEDISMTINNCPTAYSRYRKKHPFNVEIPIVSIRPKRPKQFFKELLFIAFDRGWLTWFSVNQIGFEYWAKDLKYRREKENLEKLK